MRSRSASRARTRPPGSTPASRRRATPAQTRPTPRSPAPASTTPGTRASARFALQLRRDRPGGHRDSLTQPRLERLVQPLADGQLQPARTRPRAWTPASGRRPIPGPTRRTASVSGSCRDVAGNTTVEAFALSYDATGPVVTATPGRAPDSNGWYNHALLVTFSGTDATSGVDTCVPPQTYSGPDDAERLGQRLLRGSSGEHDRSGVRAQLRRDRPGRDGDSGACSRFERLVQPCAVGRLLRARMRPRAWTRCVPPQDYSGPDSANASVSGSCRDRAGNSTVEVFSLSYDATAPTVTGASAFARARPRGLVQPRALDRLLGGGCDLGDRFVHGGELLRPRLGKRLGRRHVP